MTRTIIENGILRRRFLLLAALLAIIIVTVAGIGLNTAGPTGTEAGVDTTTLNPDRDGADIVPRDEANPGRGVDPITLLLDRDGADIAEGGGWATSDYAGVPDRLSVSPVMTRYDLMLFLEQNIWEYAVVPAVDQSPDDYPPLPGRLDYEFSQEDLLGVEPAATSAEATAVHPETPADQLD